MSESNGKPKRPPVGARVKLLDASGLPERFKHFRGFQGEVVAHHVDSDKVTVRFYGVRNRHVAVAPSALEVMAPFDLSGASASAEAG